MLFQTNSQWYRRPLSLLFSPSSLIFSCYKHLYISAWRQQVVSVFLARHNVFSNPVLALLELLKWAKVYKPHVGHV